MDPYTSALQILDGTNDITSLVDWTSVDLVMVLTKEKGTLSFDIVVPKSPTLPANTPALGDIIYLKYTIAGNQTTLFGGTVTVRDITNDGGKLLRISFTCQDWGYRFDAKLVKKAYTNMDPKAIVLDVVANFAGAGFTTNNVQTGNFLVSSIKFNYEQPTKALEALATQIGWDWYIDPNKDVHFFFAGNAQGTSEIFPAPFNIDDTSGNLDYNTIDVNVDLSNMKNSIFVVGGTYTKTYQTSPPAGAFSPIDVYTSVAGQFVYPLSGPYDQSSMIVTLGGVPQTIGTDQTTPDASAQVQYNNTNYFIRFTSDPGSGHQIIVQGKARIPILAHLTNASAIATYGEIQDSIIDAQIKSVSEAQERAYAEITQFGKPVYDVKFTTIAPTANQLYIGQSINLASASYGYGSTPYPLVIKRIEGRMRSPYLMEFAVECMGSDVVSFTDIMLYLLQQNNAQTVTSDNSVLQLILQQFESLTVTESNVIVTGVSVATPYLWGSVSPQNMRWNFFTWQ